MSLLLLALLATAEQARVVHDGGATRVEATVPGTIVGYAVPRAASGRRELVVLTAPAAPDKPAGGACGLGAVRSRFERKEGALRLFRVDAAADPVLREISFEVPTDARGLDAVDVNGDGAEDLLLLRAGRIDALHAPGFDGPLRAIDESGVDLYDPAPWAVRSKRAGPDARWRLATVGGLRTYGAAEGGAPFGLLSEVPLPLRIWRRDFGIAISGSHVSLLGPSVLATAPEMVGKDRLRLSLLTPEETAGARATECWLRLPTPERLLESAFVSLDATPYLAVTTTSAEKLGLFSEKLLRVFPLRPDRTRKGVAPVFAGQTRMNLWQSSRFHAMDVDGDGRQDLVVAYWKGLKNGTAVLDTYRRRPDGGFTASERSQEFEMESEDRSFLEYGDDVDGDGTPDLMLLAQGSLLVFSGERDPRGGKTLVARAPTLRTPIADAPKGDTKMTLSFGSEGFSGEPERGSAEPVVLDVDGDGTSEVLFLSRGDADPGKIVIVSFHGRPASKR